MALRTRARAAGIRLVGPGSGGLLDRHRGLDALLGAEPGRPGPVGVLTQSSSTARYLAAALDDVGVGVASVVTLGAKADVSGNDLLQAWADDPRVRVAVLQLESLGNPHRFVRIVRRVGRDMPVVLLRVGELLDHIPASDAALLSQLGLIDVTSMDEAAEVAALLTDPALAGTAAVAREKVAAYAEWARRPGTIAVPPTPPDRLTARTVLWSERPQAEARWIDPDGAAAVLAAYGIGVAPPDGDAGPAGAGEIRVEVTAHPQLGAILSVEASDRRDGPLRRILPLDDEGLDELVTEAAGAASRHERGALADLLLRLTLLVIDDRELVEVRLDAIDAATTPATVVGAHLRVAPPPGAWDDDVRHLRRDHP
jgi:acyl-CoA synthetase (NDP forming)